MGLIKYLSNLFTASPASNFYTVIVKCDRCGEIIEARLNLQNDLSVDYEGSKPTYHCRKTLMGDGRCFERVEIDLTFNASKSLISREITGGQFVNK